MAQNQIHWLEATVRRGLSKLYCLSLEKTPAIDMLDGAVSAWITAITATKAWSQSDEDRLEEGFNVLMTRTKKWPSPAEFLECVPRRESMPNYQGHKAPALPAPEKPALRLVGQSTAHDFHAQDEIQKIADLLRVDLSKKPEDEPKDYRQAPERPWGVDIEDWDPVTRTVIERNHDH